jgi:hypothetical protein
LFGAFAGSCSVYANPSDLAIFYAAS